MTVSILMLLMLIIPAVAAIAEGDENYEWNRKR